MSPSQEKPGVAAAPALRVTFADPAGEPRVLKFTRPFQIGRVDCDVTIPSEYVSRHHASVNWENGRWWVRDLHSSNGIFVGGQRVPEIPIDREVILRLGVEGPALKFAAEKPPPVATKLPDVQAGSETVLAQYISRYFNKGDSNVPAGEHTILVRQAFSRVQKKQRARYLWVIVLLLIAIGAAGSFAYKEHQQASKQRMLAENLFYSMKSLDVDIANIERVVLDSNSAQGLQEIARYQQRRKEMEKNYDQFLSTLHVYDPKLTAQDRVVLRIARIFGECEIDMPPEFRTEIDRYIKLWQSSGRLKRAVERAKANRYTNTIVTEFLGEDLPPQFFYLALQESDFDPYISGPPTRKGIAKGMWQFIPETGSKYGLRIGPLAGLQRPDPSDDRHHWDLETKAASRYIKDLYSTDAQASGFLVMACYNWGENQVLPLVRSLPYNPKERNFWKLLTAYREKIPQETYDYVFYIASAAVIGEDPHLFGFDFDNPLSQLDQGRSATP